MYVKILSLVSISSHSVISFVKDVVPERRNYRKHPREPPSSAALRTVYLEERFESQELSVFVDNGECQ